MKIKISSKRPSLLIVIFAMVWSLDISAKSFQLYVGQSSIIPYPSPPVSSWAVNTNSVRYGSFSTDVSVNSTDGSFKINKYFSGSITVFSQYTCTYYVNGTLQVTPLQYDYHTVTCLSNDINLSCSKTTINVGESTKLTYKFTHSTFDADVSVKYKSSSNCVSVGADGTVTGLKGGTATITATSNLGSNSSSVTITVKETAPTGVSLTENLTVNEGTSSTLTASLTPSNASTTFTWWSEDKSIATVSSSTTNTIIVNGKAPGRTKVYVQTANGYKDYCNVTVRSTAPTGIYLKEEAKLKYGASLTLQPTLEPSYAVSGITWSSSNESTATVTSAGNVSAVGEGTATITATTIRGGYQAACDVIVAPKPTHFVLCLNDGKRVAYALADNPKVINGDGKITVVDNDITIEYPLTNVHKYVLGVGTDYETVLKIGSVSTELQGSMKQSAGTLILQGFKAGSSVMVYAINGTLVTRSAIGSDGYLEMLLSHYPVGFYIVKVESQTFKFMKR